MSDASFVQLEATGVVDELDSTIELDSVESIIEVSMLEELSTELVGFVPQATSEAADNVNNNRLINFIANSFVRVLYVQYLLFSKKILMKKKRALVERKYKDEGPILYVRLMI